MIEIKNLEVTLGNFSLEPLNLEIEDGQYFIILGPSGVGKTVLVECIAGLHRLQKGEIWIDGRNVTTLRPEERNISYVPQDYALFPHLTVEENIRVGLRARKLSTLEARERVEKVARLLGVTPLLSRLPHTLSGGEKQRVALARALAIQPKLLLFDEPLVALDREKKHNLWLELKKIHEELSLTILHVTHDFEEAYTLGDKIAVILGGRLEQVGKRTEVFYHPKSPRLAHFMGIKNVLSGIVMAAEPKEDYLQIKWGKYLLHTPFYDREVGRSVSFCIRPEEVMVIREDQPLKANLKENILQGRIVGEVPGGPTYLVFFKVDGAPEEAAYHLEIQLPSHAYHRLNLAQRKEVRLSLKKSAIHVFEE